MKSKVIKILEGVLEVKVSLESSSNALDEWDSLNHVRIILEIEEVFNIKIHFNDISKLKSVNAIVSYLEKSI